MNTYTIGIVDECDCSSTNTVDLSKYDKHIQDTTVHITQKERDAWNSASAAISGVNIISALSNKADREDVPIKVSQLQNDMGYLNEVPEEYLTELELKNKGFIRISDLEGLLEGKIPALSGYATTSWVLSQGFLTEHQHIKQISDGTNTYSLIGDGVVTIKGSTSSDPGTSMVTATADRIGGIKLGYSQNGNNYPVKLDIADKAYVYVPLSSDGVEYIYYATTETNTITPIGSSPYDPSLWYKDSDSKIDVNGDSYNKREYILPAASDCWFDNPINLTTHGQIEYVSIRKKYADAEGEDAYWHQYSQPAFWTSYAKDGADATGLTLSYTDDNITVDITEEGHPSTKIDTTTVLTGNYGNEDVKFTSLPTIKARRTDGSETGFTYSSTSSVVKYTDGSANEIDILTCTLSEDQKSIDCQVNIPQDFQIDLKSPIIFTLSVEGTSTSTNNVVKGSKSFRITGIQFGKDGVSYNLVCGVASISKKYDAGNSSFVYATQSITPKIIETSVNGVADVTNQSGFEIRYSIDGETEQLLSDTNPIGSVVIGKIKQFIIINAYYNNNQFDSQTIYLVEDGAPGTGGNSPTYYQVVVTSSTLENTYQGDTLNLNGTVTFQVYSVKDGLVTNITDQNTLNITPQPGNIAIVNNTFAASYTNADATNSVQIKYLSSGTIFASASVPVPTRGKDGSSSSGSQTLTMSSLRYRGEFDTTYTYRDGVTTSESNVYYQDYVTYKNVYYLCVKEISNPSGYPNIDTEHWKPLSATDDMFVNLLVANKAYIGSLSANEIVVYDKDIDQSDRTIQAGITTGYKVDGSPIDETKKNGVRIWAGKLTDGNLATAPFTVDSTGKLKANNAEIVGNLTSGNIKITDANSYKINVSGTQSTVSGENGVILIPKTGNQDNDTIISSNFVISGTGMFNALQLYTYGSYVSGQGYQYDITSPRTKSQICIDGTWKVSPVIPYEQITINGKNYTIINGLICNG